MNSPVVDTTAAAIYVFGDPLLQDADRLGTDPLHDLGTLIGGDTAVFTI